MATMKIETFSRKPLLRRRQYYFRIVAKNGQTVAKSEGYNNRTDMMATVRSLIVNLSNAVVVALD